MRTFTQSITARLKRILRDTPENEPIFFSALRKQGRFWLDDPKDPALLIAAAESLAPVTHVRALRPGLIDAKCIAALQEIGPRGALEGDVTLIYGIREKLGYGEPSIEVVCSQLGRLRLTADAATMVVRYDRDAFELVDAHAPWIWDAYKSPALAFEEFPAFAVFDGERIAAIAAVYSHSLRWASICYWVHDDFRKRGLATRCAASLTAHLNQRGFSAAASTDETHGPSLAVMKKIGLQEFSRRALCPPRKSGGCVE